MTEIIKKDTDYAMRMLAYLALNNGESPVAARKLAAAGEVPEDFAYKILRKLTRAGLTVGTMGSHGGFKLGKAPQAISLLDVVSAIQGNLTVRECCLSRDACSRKGTCDICKILGGLQNDLTGSLQKLTLADVLKETINKN